jgi:hypothetical protein
MFKGQIPDVPKPLTALPAVTVFIQALQKFEQNSIFVKKQP